ncbi:MAG: fibronectin type III domain-containing protein [Lachnospiraceae bacterium]|nr:fibronectin type III domain-containing protein [Lachnospiraceae bacterium]
MRKEKLKGGIAILSVVIMTFSVLSGVMVSSMSAKAATTVSNPKIADDGTVTWDKITFGSYPQNAKAVAEPIKWRILDIDSSGNALLLADKGLDYKIYNEKGIKKIDGDEELDYSCAWETCTLRRWLNGTDNYANDSNAFINAAFSDEEIKSIINTTVINGDNNTIDKVYLLSIDEVKNSAYGFVNVYEIGDKTRIAKPTDYATMYGVRRYSDDENPENCWWGLRTLEDNNSYSSVVSNSGQTSKSPVWHAECVRPVLHVNLSSKYVTDAGKVNSEGVVTTSLKRTSFSDYQKPSFSNDVVTWDCVYFGRYKQNVSFERNPIEWRVLSVSGNDAFVIADKALDCKQYDIHDNGIWGECSLREWLNGIERYENDETAFIKAAFSDAERGAIISTTTINKDYGSKVDYNLTDKVFLLSVDEVLNKTYGFDTTKEESKTRTAKATNYARFNGAAIYDMSDQYAGNCRWVLRSSGYRAGESGYIFDYGPGEDTDYNVYEEYFPVRPALHVDLSSSYVKYAGTVSSNGAVLTAEEIEEQRKVDETIKLISSIGIVTKDSKAAIDAARTAYNGLSEAAKNKVSNFSVLQAAETMYSEILKNENAKTQSDIEDTTLKTPSKVKITFVKNIKKKSIVIKWKKTSDTKGYEIQYALNKKFTKQCKKATSNKVSFTIKKLKKNNKYFVRVRAYNQGANGKKVYGKWSTVKKVKVKK